MMSTVLDWGLFWQGFGSFRDGLLPLRQFSGVIMLGVLRLVGEM